MLITLAGSENGHRDDGSSRVEGEPCNSTADAFGRAAPPGSFGENPYATTGVEQSPADMQGGAITGAVNWNLSGSPQDRAQEAFEHLLFNEDMHGARRRTVHHGPIQEADVVRGKYHGSGSGNVAFACHDGPVDDVIQEPTNRSAPHLAPPTEGELILSHHR